MREQGGEEWGSPSKLQTLRNSRSLRRRSRFFLRFLTMKLLVVSLALTIFAGSQAFVLRDESKSKTDEYRQELSQCFNHLFQTLYEKWGMVAQSEIGNPVSSWLSDMAMKVEQRLGVVGDAFPPAVQEAYQQARSAHWEVERKLGNEQGTLRYNLAPETRALEQALESDLNPVLEKLDPYLQPLLQSLAQSCAGLDEKLTEVLKPALEKLQPRAEKVQEQLREAEDALDPIVGHMQKIVVSEVEGAREVLQRAGTRVLEVFNRYREGFDQWARTPLFPTDE